MDKKFILLFLVLFILLVYSWFVYESITGFITRFISLSLNVSSLTDGKFIYFSYPYVIYLRYKDGEVILSQNATFNVIFMNTGNLNISGRIVIYVKNSTLHTLGTYHDDYFYLSPLDTKNFSATFLPNRTGKYWVIANATYNSTVETKTTAENKTFDVIYGLNVRVTVSTDRNAYCPNETINMTTKLENIGYFNATGNLSSKVVDPWKNIKKEENWLNIDLSANETKYYFMNYTVQDTDRIGDYKAKSDFMYDGHYNSSSVTIRIKNGEGILLTSPSSIAKTIYSGQSALQNLHMWLDYACVDTIAKINKSSGPPGDWVTFSKDELFLGANGYLNTTVLNISVPIETEEGTYSGTVYIDTEKQHKEIPLIIHVGIFNITSSVEFFPGPPGDICLGDTLLVNVTIVTNYPGVVETNVTYRLLDPSSKVVTEWNEILEVNRTLQKNVTFTLPLDGPEGYYTFMVIVKYGSVIDQSSLTFKAISCVPIIPAVPGVPREVPAIPVVKPVYNLTLSLSTNILTVFLGNETSFFAHVKNIGTETVRSVRISVGRIPPDWVRVSPSYSDISPGETQTYVVVISVPKNASTRVYKLGVKAIDEVESNTETSTLIVGRDLKEVADLLLGELKKVRTEARESFLTEDCMNITLMKMLHEDAELAFENGMKEYESKNYEKAISWFEYAIAIEKKVISLVEINIRVEIETLGKSQIIFPMRHEFYKQLYLVMNYLDAKQYVIICEPILKMKSLIKAALVFWVLIALLIVLILIINRTEEEEEKDRRTHST
ncbi:MAG: hypothetical protein QMD36_03970 [Candidatus Aenigmarchaeota archaeon]|nr:hypothetical protein [Candidatus Aenigmarchaeota archaeon]